VWTREVKVATGIYGTDIFSKNSTTMGSSWSADTPVTTNGSSLTGCGMQPCLNFDASQVQLPNKLFYLFWSSNMPSATSFQIWYQSAIVLSHDLAVSGVAAGPQKTYPGGLKRVPVSPFVSVNTTLTNLGDFTETAQLTVTANSTVIGVSSTTLSAGQSLILPVKWNTTGVKPGCYLIKSSVASVPGEINTTNNVLIWGYIHMLPLGDLNQDGSVSFLDAVTFAADYGAMVGSSLYNPYADINGNGVVDFLDATVLASNYGIVTPAC
jgi:hypothetical protein